MREFDRHRRGLTKQRFVRGALSSAKSNTNELLIPASAGLGIDFLEIKGNTSQPYPAMVDISSATEYCGIATGEITDGNEVYEAYKANWGIGFIKGEDGLAYTAFYLRLPEEWRRNNTAFSIAKKTAGNITSRADVYLFNGDLGGYITLEDYTPLLESDKLTEVTVEEPIYTHIMLTKWPREPDLNHEDLAAFVVDYKLNVSVFAERPLPQMPIAVRSAGDNGVKVKLSGKSLVSIKDRTINVKNTSYQNISTGVTVEPSTTYTLAFDYKFEGEPILADSTRTLRIAAYTGVDIPNGNYRSNGKLFPNYDRGRFVYSFTTKSSLGNNVKLFFRVPEADVKFTAQLYVCNFMLVKGEYEELPYEKYFEPQGVSVPSRTAEEAELLLGGIGDYRDTLSVDKTSGKVRYSQRVKKTALTGQEPFELVEQDGFDGSVYCLNDYTVQYLTNQGYCSHFVMKNLHDERDAENAVYVKDHSLYFRTNGTDSLDSFKAFLEESYAKGNPVTVLMAIREPIEYYLTDTEWAKALFTFSVPYGQDGKIEAISDVSVGGIGAAYLSCENEERCNLIVSYTDTDKNPIKDSIIYSIRKNSKYKIIAPNIDGYTAVSREITGVIHEDSEITIEYRR